MYEPGITPSTTWDEAIAQAQAFPMYFTSWFTRFACEVAGGMSFESSTPGSDGLMANMVLVGRDDDKFGRVLNSLPWFGSYGGVGLVPGAPAWARTEVLTAVRALIDDPKVGFASINLVPSEMTHLSEYLDLLSPRLVVPRRTQVTALPRSPSGPEESLMSLFHPKARNAIRKGLSQGFHIGLLDTDEAWSALTAFHAANMDRVGGRAKSALALRTLRKNFPPQNRRLAVARFEGRPIAALLTARVGATVEYLVPAVHEEFRSSQALSALIWHEMLEASVTGARLWNWGGTGWEQEGLLRFKFRLGGRVVEYVTLVAYSDNALQILRKSKGQVPASLLDYYLYPFSRLHQEVRV